MARNQRHITAPLLGLMSGLLVAAAVAQQGQPFIPNESHFSNPAGTSQVYSTTGSIDLTGPFFQSLGTNGRSCGTCHVPGNGMSISAASVQQRFDISAGLDPIFRTNDGSNCDHNIDVSTLAGRRDAYSLLRTRGLIRIAITLPANRDFNVTINDNRYGCTDTETISQYRRTLPATNLRFLSAVMFEGRESSALTGTTSIRFNNYPASLLDDLKHQALDATIGHAQGDGTRPTPAEQQQIVDFEMALFTAQSTAAGGGKLSAQAANGGPLPLVTLPFFISINSSIHPLVPGLEQPGSDPFNPAIFNIFDAWEGLPPSDPRAAIARGQALFNSKPIVITDVQGINDDASAGGLVAGGIASLTGTCGTCHNTPNVGNHSFTTPLNIGAGDFGSGGTLSKGGLDLSYLPRITACKTDNSACVTTTDLGQAAIDGKFDHIGKFKGPILRGLSARAPYFHNGSAATLLDVVRFYEQRFGLVLTAREESDLVAFLAAL